MAQPNLRLPIHALSNPVAALVSRYRCQRQLPVPPPELDEEMRADAGDRDHHSSR